MHLRPSLLGLRCRPFEWILGGERNSSLDRLRREVSTCEWEGMNGRRGGEPLSASVHWERSREDALSSVKLRVVGESESCLSAPDARFNKLYCRNAPSLLCARRTISRGFKWLIFTKQFSQGCLFCSGLSEPLPLPLWEWNSDIILKHTELHGYL